LTQFLDQPGRLAGRDHKSGIEFFIRFDGFPAVKPGINSPINLFHARREGGAHTPQMIANLFASGTIAVAQFAPNVFSRLSNKRQYRLVALLAFVLRVVALASAHLLSVERVHGSVGVDGDDLQFHVGSLPDPFAHGPHDIQNLPGDVAMPRIHESPEGGLHRQLADLENARQDRVASDEAQLIQPRKADVEAQHDGQQKPVRVHGAGNPLGCQGLFHQGLESELLQHGDHRQ
jgi:hypothetical protein